MARTMLTTCGSSLLSTAINGVRERIIAAKSRSGLSVVSVLAWVKLRNRTLIESLHFRVEKAKVQKLKGLYLDVAEGDGVGVAGETEVTFGAVLPGVRGIAHKFLHLCKVVI